MGLDSFVSELLEHGHVRVAADDDPDGDERERVAERLTAFDRGYRLDLPYAPPPLAKPAALWAATMLHRACQLLVFRDLPVEAVESGLAEPCPMPANPATPYSVDLTFRFLPDLVKIARLASREDPLVERLLEWCRDWPLSSVGIEGVGPVNVDGFAGDRCLLGMYVDRIIARRDKSRLDDERVREAVGAAIGAFDELAPELAVM